MLDEALKELEQLAAARGLRVEEDDGGYSLFKGDEYLGSLWYLEEFCAWSDEEPGARSIESMVDYIAGFTKKRIPREVTYTLAFGYGRRRAPDEVPDTDSAAEKLLDAAVRLAPKLAPGAVKVELYRHGGKVTRKLPQ